MRGESNVEVLQTAQHRLFAHRELQMKEAVIKTVYRLGERDLQALTSCWIISRAGNNLREMNVRPDRNVVRGVTWRSCDEAFASSAGARDSCGSVEFGYCSLLPS